LTTNDGFLYNELKKLFKSYCIVRGEVAVLLSQTKTGKKKVSNPDIADEHFKLHPELDYFIYSTDAATKRGFKFVKNSRIGYFRPGKSWGPKYFRAKSFKFVWLKKQILSVFEEDFQFIKG
jgi:hypothetical protein